MAGDIGHLLAFGIAAGLSPIPIVGIVLMLGTPRAQVNGPVFAAAWVLSILAVGLIALAVSSGAGAGDSGSGSQGVGVLKIILGAVLVAVAFRQWSGRPRAGEAPKVPGWMNAVDKFTAKRAAALAFALSVINPKNLVLVLGAGAVIAASGEPFGEQLIALVLFSAVATIGVGTPLAIYFAMGERSAPVLARLKDWMIRHNAVLMTVICLALGALLLVEGFSA